MSLASTLDQARERGVKFIGVFLILLYIVFLVLIYLITGIKRGFEETFWFLAILVIFVNILLLHGAKTRKRFVVDFILKNFIISTTRELNGI